MDELKRLSRFMSLVLRHRAEDFGVTLDASGYTDLANLHAVLRERYHGAIHRNCLTS